MVVKKVVVTHESQTMNGAVSARSELEGMLVKADKAVEWYGNSAVSWSSLLQNLD